MRVLVIADYFLPTIGGAQIRAIPLMKRLRSAGHSFLVVSADLRPGDINTLSDYEGIAVQRFPFIEALRAGDVKQIGMIRSQVRSLVAASAPDVVHAHASGPAVLLHLDGPFADLPLIVSLTIWPTHPEASATTLLGHSLRDAAWVTVNSDVLAQRVRQLVPETRERSSVLRSGNVLPDVAPGPLPLAPAVLLGLGRVVEEKGFDLAIRALARLPRSVRLIVAGDGPARSGLERLAIVTDVADRVEFRGWVAPESVPALINESTLVLVPSRWNEAFASVAIQAAQLGRPVIASRVGGMSEAVIDGSTGLLFAAEDDVGLAAAIKSLLDDPARLLELGERARTRALRDFSFTRYASDVEHLYCQVVDNFPNSHRKEPRWAVPMLARRLRARWSCSGR